MYRDQNSSHIEHHNTTFTDAMRFLRAHCLKISIAIALGGLVGFSASFLFPRKWEANVTVQIGQIYDGTTTVPLEPPMRVIERIRSQAFLNEANQRDFLPGKNENDPDVRLFLRTANAKLIRSSDLLELQVGGYSVDSARRSLQAVINHLFTTHGQIVDPTVKRMRNSLGEVGKLLAEAEARQVQLDDAAHRALTRQKDGSVGASDILLTQLIGANSESVRRLEIRKGELEEQLNPQRTFNTRLLGEILVGREPAYPNRAAAIFVGALAALLLLVVWLLWRGEPAT